MLCVKDREEVRYEEEKELNFNPALDAAGAFMIATGILASSTGLAIIILGKQYQLESWQDWRMFIQGRHLGPLLIPKGLEDSVSSWIPKSLRLPTETDNGPETDPSIDPDQWEWKQTLDCEWKQDMVRQEAERQEWVAKRESAGKRIW